MMADGGGSFNESFFDKTERVEFKPFPDDFEASAFVRLEVGNVKGYWDWDPNKVEARGGVEATTVRATGGGRIGNDHLGGALDVFAEGPTVRVTGKAGLDGIGFNLGGSPGGVGYSAGGKVLGDEYRLGGEIRPGLEFGVVWDNTSRLDFGPLSIEAPNPSAAIAQWTIEAAKDMFTDPVGTAENVFNDVTDAPGDVVDAVEDFFGGSDEPDDRAVTNDNWNTTHERQAPGAQRID